METIFENQWCRIVSKGTIYILQSKQGKYNDQYFQTSTAAYKAIGIDPYNYNFGQGGLHPERCA